MKRTLIYKSIFASIFLVLNISCGKLELLKNASLEAIDAGSNLKELTFTGFLSKDHTSDLTNLNLFGQAINQAGLSDFLDEPGDYTMLFMTNQAVNVMVTSLGYSNLSEVPPVVLKNILSDNIFKGRLHSFDLGLGETKKFETINGNHIYFTRSSTSSNEYVLTANNSSDLNSPSATIRSQNLEFKNGIAHVTDQFTFYKLKDAVPDAPSGGVGNSTDTFFVSKDVFIQNGTANRSKNFNNTTSIDMKNSNGKDVSVDRMGLFQFPLTTPSFGDKIGLAKLNVYVYFTGLASSFSAYAGDNTDWDETQVTWLTAPVYDRISLANASLNASFAGWVSMEITQFVNQLYGSDKSYVNILMNHNNDNFVKVYPREYLSGKFKSYITVSSPPESILTLENQSALTVSTDKGFAALSLDNLKMRGTTDKNIKYIISKAPLNGYLVKYGIPLLKGKDFSQADLLNGSVKYLYAGSGASDEFEVEAKDHNGGYYETPIKIAVNIQ